MKHVFAGTEWSVKSLVKRFCNILGTRFTYLDAHLLLSYIGAGLLDYCEFEFPYRLLIPGKWSPSV